MSARGQAKKRGQQAAKTWIKANRLQCQIDVAGSGFEYGVVLDDLRGKGLSVPASQDADFSWGFFKQVKGYVHHKLRQRSEACRGGK